MAQARNSEVAKLPPDLVKLALDAPRAVYMALRRPDGYGRGWGYSAWDVFDGSPDLGIKIGTLANWSGRRQTSNRSGATNGSA